MEGTFIFIILLFRVVQAFFHKRSSNSIRNITMLVGYNAYTYSISAVLALVLIAFTGAGFKVDFLTVLFATFSGLAFFFATFCSINAMKSGTVSLDSMFGTAGMIIPILAGVFLFNKQVAPMQYVGLAVFFVSAYFLINASKTVYSNFSYKTLLFLVGSMISNGCTMLAQQMFTTYVPEGDVSVFSFLSFGIIAVLSAIFYGTLTTTSKSKKGMTGLSKQLLVCGVALAIALFIINQLATICTKTVPPAILFTFICGGGTIISTVVAAIVYKEKISKKTALGIILGIVSLVILKVFE